MKKIQGKIVSPGIGIEKLRYFGLENRTEQINSAARPREEIKRFTYAVSVLLLDLDKRANESRKKNEIETAELLEAHMGILEDPDFIDGVHSKIENEKKDVVSAVLEVSKEFSEIFSAMDDLYMKARSEDIQDIANQLISNISGKSQEISLTSPSILCMENISPSQFLSLKKENLSGVLLKKGSLTGHVAILLRTAGIPAIFSLEEDISSYDGKVIIIDGFSGEIILDPDEDTLRHYKQLKKEKTTEKENLSRCKGLETKTKDGKKIKLYCNIQHPSDVKKVLANDGNGIGLFRSEFLFMNRDSAPSEEEQFEAYRHVLSEMKDKEVIIRTLDIGADKEVSYLNLQKEDNPAMGLRGLRLCLVNVDLFKTQLRALYKAASFGNLKIMFPMVSDVWEVLEAKKICKEVQDELRMETGKKFPHVPLGIMIETPSAALSSDILAKEVEFFSVGTNDLTQYTLACDRTNDHLNDYYHPHHSSVLELIRIAAKNATASGIEIGVCGELAADTEMTKTLLEMGITELSVSPEYVLPIRKSILES